MLLAPRLLAQTLKGRCISTTCTTNFKFKLTEEMSREYEEQERLKKEAELAPEQAIHTKESSLIMGRVSSERYKEVVRVGVPKHRLNDCLILYVRENDNIYAHDEGNQCKPGDWVLLRRQANPVDKNVAHKVEKVIHTYGKWIDPLTGRRSLGIYYDDDFSKLEKMKVEL